MGLLVFLVAVVAVRVSVRTGLPSLLLFLGIGMLLGEEGLGIPFEDMHLAHELGLVALAVILAEGGLSTRWPAIRPVLPLAAVLATVGVAVSVTVVGALTYWLVDVDLRTALVLGAVVSSTDAAAVFAIMRTASVRARLSAVLEAESGLNDAPAVILVTLLTSSAWRETSVLAAAADVVVQMAGGLAVGLTVGWLGVQLLRRVSLPTSGLYPLATFAVVLLAYALAARVGLSGFLAVYVAGVILGAARLPHRMASLGFAEGLATIAQIGLFVMLGLLASPARLPGQLVPALVVGACLTFVARPLSVLVSVTPFRMPWREQAFLSWAGLRGAVPIVLATIPATSGLPHATAVFDDVLILVVVFTVVQGPGLLPVARRLGVTEPELAHELEVEAAPLGEIDADLLSVTVGKGSRLRGVYVDELRLPPGAQLSLVVRDGASLVPDGETRLRPDDRLLVVTTPAARDAVELRLRAVSAAGRLARWYGVAAAAPPRWR